jgi:hypothetical protein
VGVIIPPWISVGESRGQERQISLDFPDEQVSPSPLLPIAPASAPSLPYLVAHPFRLGQQGDNEQVKEMPETGARGLLPHPFRTMRSLPLLDSPSDHHHYCSQYRTIRHLPAHELCLSSPGCLGLGDSDGGGHSAPAYLQGQLGDKGDRLCWG